MIYLCYEYWKPKDFFANDPDILRIGMVTLDKAKAEEFCQKNPAYSIEECEDGQEWPL